MATRLTKPVSRIVENWSNTADGKRPLVVTLNPAGFISVRLKGLHDEYDIGFESVYVAAVRRFADKQRKEKQQEKELKREGLA